MATSRKLFVNLQVKDLPRAMGFWKELGFAFNPQFTDENAACMILSEEAFCMLLTPKFFQGFTKKQPCDTGAATETMLALSCESRPEVDQLAQKALALGGKPAMPAMDHGFMYACSFYDLDDHHWEVVWMDPAHVQK
jgi:uncharacterized protein